MEPNPARMDQLTRNLPSISEKIRVLGRAGYARADIAKFLGKRYQHVRNVLEHEDTKKLQTAAKPVGPAKVRMSTEGRIVIPAAFREAIGAKDGDVLFLRLEDGELRLSTIGDITKRVRTLMRQIVPAGTSLVDELIAERRREAKRESDSE